MQRRAARESPCEHRKMANSVPGVKGMRVLDELTSATFYAVERKAREVFGRYGYGEIRTPILERTELFSRSVGESTDIVGKEMYTFDDRGGRSLTLRPEGTAPVVRALVDRGLRGQPLPLKLFYLGPYFRYERPQKGRYRQFHQIGAELIGDPRPEADAEVISMLVEFFTSLGFQGLSVGLQTLGDTESRTRFRSQLLEYLEPRVDGLSEDSRRRLQANPLRILDSKIAADQEILVGAPTMETCLSAEAASRFSQVQELLDALEINYSVQPGLVRGLDYYTGTVFEIVSSELGAQDALVGGGRYDDLIGELGGPDMPAIGFAIGLDRVCEALPKHPVDPRSATPVAVVGLGNEGAVKALQVASDLRDVGLTADARDGARGIGKALKAADRRGVRWVVLIGDQELTDNVLTLKDLQSGEQIRVGGPTAVAAAIVEAAEVESNETEQANEEASEGASEEENR